jgi:hypothetical protein
VGCSQTLVISNVLNSKVLTVGPLSMTGGMCLQTSHLVGSDQFDRFQLQTVAMRSLAASIASDISGYRLPKSRVYSFRMADQHAT